MKTRILLAVVLCISGNIWAYSGDGNGSAENPYQIANVSDFQQLSATSGDWSKAFILTADINLTGQTFAKAPIAPNINVIPNGNFQGTMFSGSFDGNGHTISNLNITAPVNI